jgi:DNA-binding GntR family transcriptional regulator
VIPRRPLRSDVEDAIRERLIQGEIAPGSRLRDTALAAQLGVSRTPVREALVRLAHAGLVDADAGRGFAARALRASEVRDQYPILWTLEVLALRLSPALTPARRARLAAINARLRAAGSAPLERVALDGEWHRTLVEACPNAPLRAMIEALRARLAVYEHAYARRFRVASSTAEHAAIAAALRRGELPAALATLEANWRGTRDRLLAWLDGDDRDDGVDGARAGRAPPRRRRRPRRAERAPS